MTAKQMGRKGGKARAKNMTAKERSEACSIASIARWSQHRKSKCESASLVSKKNPKRISTRVTTGAKNVAANE